ncbi:GNAT family N-acetyltransferase [Lutibacter aestuarii]|uniref:GNAT family N-acetyltransferase n=1 Tax=Lutibacter aestuarii TaxID=861111 RepID=A0ABW2Z8P6_9FLAO|nr:GNAT family N-acetyltransferase [uncultured Lutibacter sp.]
MRQISLNTIDNTYFYSAWKLYEEAFPIYERRTLKAQTKLFGNHSYKFDLFVQDDVFIGFILWWNFKDFQYIDHFAVSKLLRNKGYGAKILQEFIKSNSKPTLLEVELPDSPLNKRRIKFYERLGFKLNLHNYKVPSSIDNRKIDLLVMSYPEVISKEKLNQFVVNNHPTIFNS